MTEVCRWIRHWSTCEQTQDKEETDGEERQDMYWRHDMEERQKQTRQHKYWSKSIQMLGGGKKKAWKELNEGLTIRAT